MFSTMKGKSSKIKKIWKFNWGDELKRTKMMFWAAMFAFFTASLLSAILGCCLAIMLPMKEIVPMFLTTNDSKNQIVHVEPISKSTNAMNVITENLVKKYVDFCESVDHVSEMERWHEVKLLSSDGVFNTFAKEIKTFYDEAENRGVTRAIEILGTSPISESIYFVDFRMTQKVRGEVNKIQKYRAAIQYSISPSDIKGADAYKNPIGFKVVKYAVNETQ